MMTTEQRVQRIAGYLWYTQLNTIDMLTPFDQSFLFFQNGVQTNSLSSILYQDSDDVDGMDTINIINNYTGMDN